MSASAAAVVHVVDDDASMRTGVARLLRVHGYDVREYTSAGHFLLAPPRDHAGCILLDLSMPGPSGLELQAALAELPSSLPIVFLTGRGDVASSVRAMKAGAVDFLTKPVDPELLLQAVQTALARGEVARRDGAARAAAQRAYAQLTERERQVLAGVVAGQLNKQIAAVLGIAERTVKMHRAQVMQKMDVASVADLVRLMSTLERGGGAR
ncbi:MAG: response regulator transcription factor [Proteobacteria bacterium]|nr:response regulator transcription factor [Pseudomonadota bacterium]